MFRKYLNWTSYVSVQNPILNFNPWHDLSLRYFMEMFKIGLSDYKRTNNLLSCMYCLCLSKFLNIFLNMIFYNTFRIVKATFSQKIVKWQKDQRKTTTFTYFVTDFVLLLGFSILKITQQYLNWWFLVPKTKHVKRSERLHCCVVYL